MMYVIVGTYCSQSFLVFIFNESTFRSARPSWRPCEEDRIKSLEMSPYCRQYKSIIAFSSFFRSLPLAQFSTFFSKKRRRKDDGHIHTLASCYACFGCPLEAQDGHITWGPTSQSVCRVQIAPRCVLTPFTHLGHVNGVVRENKKYAILLYYLQ